MHSVLNQDIFASRRSKLLSLLPNNSAVILLSASEKIRNRDNAYPFRQDSNFWYFSGFPEDRAVMVLARRGKKDFYMLCSKPRDPELEIWTGHIIGPSEAKTLYAADETHSIDDAAEKIAAFLSEAEIKNIYTAFDGKEIASESQEFFQTVKAKGGAANSANYLDIEPFSSELRLIKSIEEQNLMFEAGRISALGHRAAMLAAKPNAYEYTVQAAIEAEFRRHKGCSPAFSTIAAAGKNACCLHYQRNSSPLKDGDLLLIDAGAEYAGYAGDISRTFPINGKFSRDQQALYEVVLHAQTEAIKNAKIGKTHAQLHRETAILLMQGLIDLQIIEADAAELVESGDAKKYYPHGTGHWLGLDTHDVGSYKETDGSPRIYREGMTLTVEPGIYLQEHDETIPERWRGIGIRIEDDILITQQGAEVLTVDAPKTISEIEQFLAGRS
ncbi:MAG: aminopeptidase P N-terminal domain-containing protein [Cardiobacteriaceae bacterium]|nr:aminopeptidase P N-terminal domain-containing protein [Cardiobacteriaceae bacterium]